MLSKIPSVVTLWRFMWNGRKGVGIEAPETKTAPTDGQGLTNRRTSRCQHQCTGLWVGGQAGLLLSPNKHQKYQTTRAFLRIWVGMKSGKLDIKKPPTQCVSQKDLWIGGEGGYKAAYPITFKVY